MVASTQPKSSHISQSEAENITRVEELSYELKIEEVMTRNVKTFNLDIKMKDVLENFRQERISGAPVLNGNKLEGIISIEDLIRCMIQSDLEAPVSKYMTSNPVTVKGTDSVIEALKLFVSYHFGRLPVVDDHQHLVGIITKGNITSGLLKSLQRDIQEEEIKRYRASHLFEDIESDRTSLILRYNINPHDFTHGGGASSNIKRALLRLGATPQIARRCGIAIYEAEMNLIIHTNNGGVLRVEIEPDQIYIEASDDGPGIKDISLAMKPGYSTASEKIRELGFGAGMGLVNIARCADKMELESVWGQGTRLKLKIKMQGNETVGEGYSAQNKDNAK